MATLTAEERATAVVYGDEQVVASGQGLEIDGRSLRRDVPTLRRL